MAYLSTVDRYSLCYGLEWIICRTCMQSSGFWCGLVTGCWRNHAVLLCEYVCRSLPFQRHGSMFKIIRSHVFVLDCLQCLEPARYPDLSAEGINSKSRMKFTCWMLCYLWWLIRRGQALPFLGSVVQRLSGKTQLIGFCRFFLQKSSPGSLTAWCKKERPVQSGNQHIQNKIK